MRKQTVYFLSILFLGLSIVLKGQDDNAPKTLFSNGTMLQTEKLGFFIAPSLGLTSLDGSTASLLNLRGAISFDDRVSFGGFYSLSLNQIKPESEVLDGAYLDYWSAGVFAEYTVYSERLLHLSMPLYLGYGEVQLDNESGDAALGEASFFQIEPGILLELNLHSNVRFNLGAGYRLVTEMDYRNFNQDDMSGVTGYLGLKLGLFR